MTNQNKYYYIYHKKDQKQHREYLKALLKQAYEELMISNSSNL